MNVILKVKYANILWRMQFDFRFGIVIHTCSCHCQFCGTLSENDPRANHTRPILFVRDNSGKLSEIIIIYHLARLICSEMLVRVLTKEKSAMNNSTIAFARLLHIEIRPYFLTAFCEESTFKGVCKFLLLLIQDIRFFFSLLPQLSIMITFII